MRRGAVVTAFIVACLLVTPWAPGAASASTWVAALTAGSHGEGQSQALPVPSPSAACQNPTSKVIVVIWSATSHANYTVYRSNTTVGGTYTSVATGVVGGTWTSASLANGNYWFKVQAFIGTNWASGQSAATGETTIQNGATTCVQP
jgi:hypothetical protein